MLLTSSISRAMSIRSSEARVLVTSTAASLGSKVVVLMALKLAWVDRLMPEPPTWLAMRLRVLKEAVA